MDLYDELPSSTLVYDENFEQLLDSARVHKISALTILTLTSKELVPLLKRSINEISLFKDILEKEYDEYLTTKLQNKKSNVKQQLQAFTTGEPNIDEMLGGGIFTENITEVYGESSTGKTQFLMQLSLTVQLPVEKGGLGGKCVYISTEGDLFTNRVQQLIDTRFSDQETQEESSGLPNMHKVNQNNIYYVNCSDFETQEHILNVQLPVLLEKDPDIRLVIIDSISHHIRAEHESHSFLESQNNRFKIERLSANLLKLCSEKNLSIVVANQVSNKVFNFQQYENTIHGSMSAENKLSLKKNYTECEKYDYQLGYMVGWKASNIKYTHMLINFNNTVTDEVLSDDEEYAYLDNLMCQLTSGSVVKRETNNDSNKLHGRERDNQSNNSDCTSSSASNNGTSKPQVENLLKRPNSNKAPYLYKKRKYSHKNPVDTAIPTLGLTWANNVTTRLLLKKKMVVAPKLKLSDKSQLSLEDLRPEKALVKKRTMKVVFSSFCQANALMEYTITPKGIVCE